MPQSMLITHCTCVGVNKVIIGVQYERRCYKTLQVDLASYSPGAHPLKSRRQNSVSWLFKATAMEDVCMQHDAAVGVPTRPHLEFADACQVMLCL